MGRRIEGGGTKSGHNTGVGLSSGHITAGPLLDSGQFKVFLLMLEVQAWYRVEPMMG